MNQSLKKVLVKIQKFRQQKYKEKFLQSIELKIEFTDETKIEAWQRVRSIKIYSNNSFQTNNPFKIFLFFFEDSIEQQIQFSQQIYKLDLRWIYKSDEYKNYQSQITQQKIKLLFQDIIKSIRTKKLTILELIQQYQFLDQVIEFFFRAKYIDMVNNQQIKQQIKKFGNKIELSHLLKQFSKFLNYRYEQNINEHLIITKSRKVVILNKQQNLLIKF